LYFEQFISSYEIIDRYFIHSNWYSLKTESCERIAIYLDRTIMKHRRSLWTLACCKLHSIFIALYMRKEDRVMFVQLVQRERTHNFVVNILYFLYIHINLPLNSLDYYISVSNYLFWKYSLKRNDIQRHSDKKNPFLDILVLWIFLKWTSRLLYTIVIYVYLYQQFSSSTYILYHTLTALFVRLKNGRISFANSDVNVT